MPSRKPRKPVRRIILITAIGLTLPVLLQLSFTAYFNQEIRRELQEEVKEQSKGEYELTIETLSINIFSQSVFISGIALKPDLSINPESPKYAGEATSLALDDFHLFSFLFKKDLIVEGFAYEDPALRIFRGSPREREKIKDKQKFSPYSVLKKHLNSLRIKEIAIRNADIRMFESVSDTAASIVSPDNELKISGFRINDSTDNAGQWFAADDIRLTINNFKYKRKGAQFSYSASRLFATQNSLRLEDFKLRPKYSSTPKNGISPQDSIRITVEKADFTGLDLRSCLERSAFVAKKLSLYNPDLYIFHYVTEKRNPKRKKSVQENIRLIPIHLNIGSIRTENGKITYHEMPKVGKEPGKIFFTKADITITGCSNDSTFLVKNKVMIAVANAQLMNRSPFHVRFTFPLDTNKVVFDAAGRVDNVETSMLNPVLRPLAKVDAKSGHLDSMYFSFHADETSAKGNMLLVYRDLKIELLDKESGKPNLFTKTKGWLLHGFVLKEENPSGGKLRPATISYPGDSTRFLFFYAFRSMLSGVRQTLGLPPEKPTR